MGKITIIAQQKVNQPPTVNAGDDISINLPATGVSLSATASDSDGYITSVQWSILSGGPFVINSPSTLDTTISGLPIGIHVVQIIVYDNLGASAVDTLTIEVKNYQLFVPLWVPESISCELDGGGNNTGKVKYNILKKVSDDSNQFPLDVNNQKIVDTGLPQDSKPNIVGDPNYVLPYTDLIACPTIKKFHSIFTPKDTGRTTASNPTLQPGAGPYMGIYSLDNSSVIENNLPGITFTSMLGNTLQVLKTSVAGNYVFKVRGSGTVFNSTTGGTGWFMLIDFFLTIGGVNYPLSTVFPPISGTTFSEPHMYKIQSPDGSSSDYREGSAPFTLNGDVALNLPINTIVELKIAVRFESTPRPRNGNFILKNTSVELEIKL